MYSVYIDGKDTYTDYGLILTDVKINPPQAKRTTINVQGTNGLLELTPQPVRYNNRQLEFTFAKADRTFSNWENFAAGLLKDLIGEKTDIRINKIGAAANTWHWQGFVSISGIELTPYTGRFKIRVDAYPYQIGNQKTTSKSISTTASNVSITNEGSAPLESFKATSTRECTLTYGTSSVTISANTETVIRINIPVGTTNISAKTTSGSGTLTIKWTEERL